MHRILLNEYELTYNNSANFITYEDFNNKTILITGAKGLIGKYFVDYLMYLNMYKNFNINIIALGRNAAEMRDIFSEFLDEKQFKIIESDVIDIKLGEVKIDYIIHAASPANPYLYSKYPVDVIKANVIGTINLLDYCIGKSTKFIYISSGEIYGSQTNNMDGFIETQPGIVDSMNVRSCYTESKRLSETLTVSYADQYNINGMVARLSFIYGHTYSPKDNRVIFQFINKFLNNQDIVMLSEGSQLRSYTYISDCITGILTILLKGENKNAYNISNSNSVLSIKNIAQEIEHIDGYSGKIVYYKMTDEDKKGFSPYQNAVQNSAKLEKLGWKPKVNFKEGLDRIIKIKKVLNQSN